MDGETVELSPEERQFAANILALVVAAGGRIVCRPSEMRRLMDYTLVVTEDVATGCKTYVAERSRPKPDSK